MNDRIRSALRDGVTLAFALDVSVSRHRRLWLDATVLETTLRRELTYHAVTDRYVLRDEAGVEQESFPTLEAALDKLGRVEDLPILVESQLRGEAQWEVAVRAGVRRFPWRSSYATGACWWRSWSSTSASTRRHSPRASWRYCCWRAVSRIRRSSRTGSPGSCWSISSARSR